MKSAQTPAVLAAGGSAPRALHLTRSGRVYGPFGLKLARGRGGIVCPAPPRGRQTYAVRRFRCIRHSRLLLFAQSRSRGTPGARPLRESLSAPVPINPHL